MLGRLGQDPVIHAASAPMLDVFRQRGISNLVYGVVIAATIFAFVVTFRPNAQSRTASLSESCAARMRGRCIDPEGLRRGLPDAHAIAEPGALEAAEPEEARPRWARRARAPGRRGEPPRHLGDRQRGDRHALLGLRPRQRRRGGPRGHAAGARRDVQRLRAVARHVQGGRAQAHSTAATRPSPSTSATPRRSAST